MQAIPAATTVAGDKVTAGRTSSHSGRTMQVQGDAILDDNQSQRKGILHFSPPMERLSINT